MTNLIEPRKFAREIFDEALRAVDASAALLELHCEDQKLIIRDLAVNIANQNVYSLAIGKAAPKMAGGLDGILQDKLKAGVVAGPESHLNSLLSQRGWEIFRGGHPLPDETSLRAADAAFELLEQASRERALIIFLISGGGSAMIERPNCKEITLSDLHAANQLLVESGASISEINSVRRAFSAVKGGRLAARAPNCDQITLIISDVPSGQEWNVASGPTLSPPPDAAEARAVIEKYQLRSQLPLAILSAIDADSGTPAEFVAETTNLRKHFMLLSNEHALEAAASAARRRGYTAEIARDISDEPIETGCEELLQRLSDLAQKTESDHCVISGGEFSCPVRGAGLGGRNLETALRLAIEYAKSAYDRPFVALCAGTDGIDGNSPAAGAIIDSTTIERAHRIGLDPQDFLNRSDAYSFFVALGDAITTGPTGTNVRDLRILLQGA